jgi:anion-transporting  ArsA/GET3 family ATPase
VSVAELLEGKRICICAGSGGVGKTTTAAAVALGMAARGQRVAVVTIDPARRLADALGLGELGNEPALVDPAPFARRGLAIEGELHAMTLDSKRTFDELIERLAPDERSRDEILANRIYRELSGAIAGSQEFTAIAKLYELDERGDFDLLVLDTPPSRNALDFLDAPERLSAFFEGRALQLLLRPAGVGFRLVGKGGQLAFSILSKATGIDLLSDLSQFFTSLSGVIDGIRERARRVGELLADPGTTFLLVSSPEPEPVDEAIWFRRKLRAADMPFAGVVVNRVDPLLARDGDAAGAPVDEPELAAALAGPLGDETLARRAATAYAEARAGAGRESASLARLASGLGDPPRVVVPRLDGDVHDLDGLIAIQSALFAD